jgi:hypothetical protein
MTPAANARRAGSGTLITARKTDKRAPATLDDIESDVFIFLRTCAGPQREQTRGEFRVVHYRRGWRVCPIELTPGYGRDSLADDDGHQRHQRLHRDREARISDPEDPRRVFSWLLEEARDDRGNVVRYTYKAEDAAGVDRGSASESELASRTGTGRRRSAI